RADGVGVVGFADGGQRGSAASPNTVQLVTTQARKLIAYDRGRLVPLERREWPLRREGARQRHQQQDRDTHCEIVIAIVFYVAVFDAESTSFAEFTLSAANGLGIT